MRLGGSGMFRRVIKHYSAAALVPFALILVAALVMTAQSPSAAQQRAETDDPSVLDGVFTDAQADGGRTVFQAQCVVCHGLPEFTQGAHTPTAKWQNVGDMFMSIASTMPMNDPGGLSWQEYAAVVSYILQANGYPAGEEELPADINKLLPIRVVPKP
jgi:mono/diheme cytochrome c family protein